VQGRQIVRLSALKGVSIVGIVNTTKMMTTTDGNDEISSNELTEIRNEDKIKSDALIAETISSTSSPSTVRSVLPTSPLYGSIEFGACTSVTTSQSWSNVIDVNIYWYRLDK
jgi:hypothetical protein